MTDLTEQWKNGRLPAGAYYVLLITGEIFPDSYNPYGYFEQFESIVKKVIAPVPSYDEWVVTNSIAESYHALQEKNVELVHEINKRNDLLKECLHHIDMWRYTDSNGNALYPQIKQAIRESEE